MGAYMHLHGYAMKVKLNVSHHFWETKSSVIYALTD